MSKNTTIARSNGQVIDDQWVNTLRKTLIGDIFPRNSSGVVTTEAGSLGSESYRFLTAYLMNAIFKSTDTGNTVTIKAPATLAANRTYTLPDALPSSDEVIVMNSSGVLSTQKLTQALRSSSNYAESSNFSFSTTSSSFVDVTNSSMSITCTGRPIQISIRPNTSSGLFSVGSNDVGLRLILLRGSTEIARFYSLTGGTQSKPFSSGIRDNPGAGTFTYKLQVSTVSGTAQVYGKMVCWEVP